MDYLNYANHGEKPMCPSVPSVVKKTQPRRTQRNTEKKLCAPPSPLW